MAPDAGTLFPPLTPFDRRELPVAGGHVLYLEQFGDPEGICAIFLHGGPGSGCQADQARLFDPARYRAVLFDQRGAGRSRPKRALRDNTTGDLVADMEAIRRALRIERWLLVGGSWGSTLAIAYAEAHPERVLGLVLRAVFLGTAAETRWAFCTAARTFYPDLWRRFLALLPEAERGDPIAAYGARLMDPDPRVHVPAARAWHDYERVLSVLKPGALTLPESLFDAHATAESQAPNTPYVEWHYIRHDFFLAPGALLDGADRLAGIPGIIVQGRYDLLCPPKTAAALAARWPDGELRIIPGAGHSAAEPAIRAGLVKAIRDIAERIDSGA